MTHNRIGNDCSMHVDVLLHDANQARGVIQLMTDWVRYLPGSGEMFSPDATRGTFGAAAMSVSAVLPSEPSPSGEDVDTPKGETE
jgi:hypothetical protein